MNFQSGEGVVPIIGIVKVVVEQTARIVSVEVVVRSIGAHGLGVWLGGFGTLAVMRPPRFLWTKVRKMLRRKPLLGEKRIKFFSQWDQYDADKLKNFEVDSSDGV